MKRTDVFEKIRSNNPAEREDAVWEIYVNAIHSFKTLAYYAAKEEDANLKILLDSMVRDFKAERENDKENS